MIISKLEWAKRGGPERQLEDVAELARRRGPSLDNVYLARWIAGLDLANEWKAAQRLIDRKPDQ